MPMTLYNDGPSEGHQWPLPESIGSSQQSHNPAVSPISEGTRCPSPGLEPVLSDDETLKETASTRYFGSPEKESFPPPLPHQHPAYISDASEKPRRAPLKSQKRTWIVAAVAVAVLLGVALGVGLGVGLKEKGYASRMEVPTSSRD